MTTPRPERSRPVRILDLVIGIGLTVIAAFIGLILLAFIGQLGQLATLCEGITPDGMRCDPGFLNAMTILGTAIIVLGWGLPAGFVVVRAIQKKLTFFLPIISIVIMYVGYVVPLALLGSSYQPA